MKTPPSLLSLSADVVSAFLSPALTSALPIAVGQFVSSLLVSVFCDLAEKDSEEFFDQAQMFQSKLRHCQDAWGALQPLQEGRGSCHAISFFMKRNK